MHGGFITFYTLKVQENHLYIPIENPAPLFKRLHVCTYPCRFWQSDQWRVQYKHNIDGEFKSVHIHIIL